MEYFGRKVHSQAFGEGTIDSSEITNNNNISIYVRFGDNIQGPFRYPDAFEQGWLQTSDPIITNDLNAIHDNQICDKCGQRKKEVDRKSGTTICCTCQSNQTYCIRCKTKIYKGQDAYILFSGCYCRSCLEKEYFSCTNCGEWIPYSEKMISKNVSHENLCVECANTLYPKCVLCNEFVIEDQMICVDNYWYVCPECYSTRFHKCNRCNIEYLMQKKDSGICEKCDAYFRYKEYIQQYDFESATKEYIQFGTFVASNNTSDITRLRMTEGDEISKREKYKNKSRFDLWIIESYRYSLVITYAIPSELYTYDKAITLSDLKKAGAWLVVDKKAGQEFTTAKLDNERTILLWERPYLFRAITDYDKDYGDRYYWSGKWLDHVEEGNKYGDTSHFLIVGYVDNSKKEKSHETER